MKVKIDRTHDVAYVKLKKGKVAQTIEVRPGILLDIDKSGEVLDIELLSYIKLSPELKLDRTSKKKVA